MPPAEALPLSTPPRSGPDASFGWRLPRTTRAACAARHVVAERFGDQLAQETLDDALLVVSELVTNALVHGKGDIELRMVFDGQRVTGDVSDEGIRFAPRLHKRNPDQAGGQGLFLVGRVADSWGLRADTNGVWFEILARPL